MPAAETFRNLTGQGTGLVGVVARTAAEALVLAGSRRPDMIIFDLFLPDCDGFAAIRSLAALDDTRGAEIIATTLTVTRVSRSSNGRPIARLISESQALMCTRAVTGDGRENLGLFARGSR